jgi:hypothetical protein
MFPDRDKVAHLRNTATRRNRGAVCVFSLKEGRFAEQDRFDKKELHQTCPGLHN